MQVVLLACVSTERPCAEPRPCRVLASRPVQPKEPADQVEGDTLEVLSPWNRSSMRSDFPSPTCQNLSAFSCKRIPKTEFRFYGSWPYLYKLLSTGTGSEMLQLIACRSPGQPGAGHELRVLLCCTPKPAAAPQRLTELQESSVLTHAERHRASLGISTLCCHGISNLTAKVLIVMIVSPIPPAPPQSKDEWLVKQ